MPEKGPRKFSGSGGNNKFHFVKYCKTPISMADRYETIEWKV
jgi:hypothetical protein